LIMAAVAGLAVILLTVGRRPGWEQYKPEIPKAPPDEPAESAQSVQSAQTAQTAGPAAPAEPGASPFNASAQPGRAGDLEGVDNGRSDGPEVFRTIFDAREQVLSEVKAEAKRLLPKVDESAEDKAFVQQTLEGVEAEFQALEENRSVLRLQLENTPEGRALAMPEFEASVDGAVGQWVKAMDIRFLLAETAFRYDEALRPEQYRTEKARLALADVAGGLELLDKIRWAAPGVTPERARECIVAFVVDLAASDGKFSDEDSANLNRMLSRNWNASQYLSRYAAKVGNDTAGDDLVWLMVNLHQRSKNMALFLNKSLDAIMDRAVTTGDGLGDGQLKKIGAFTRLLQERLGA